MCLAKGILVLMKSRNYESRAQRVLQCAKTLREVECAWSLVYEIYLAQRIIRSNPYRIHAPPAGLGRRACVIHDSGGQELISTMTMIRDGGQGLPLDTVARGTLDQLRSHGRKLVETGMLAIRDINSRCRKTALFGLMRWAAYFTLHEGADDIVIGVHPHHVGFYVRGFGFDVLTPVLGYPTLRGKAVVVLRLRLREHLERGESLPRGLAFVARHPVERHAFAHRCLFHDDEVAKSLLALFLKPRDGKGASNSKYAREKPLSDHGSPMWDSAALGAQL